TPPGIPGGGIRNAIAGTILIVGLAAAMAVPVGVAAALFLMERPGRLAAAIRFGADVATGAPSIAIGIFAYILVVQPLRHFSALPLVIYANGTQAFPDAQEIAWGTALVLLVLVLILSISARVVAARLGRGPRRQAGLG